MASRGQEEGPAGAGSSVAHSEPGPLLGKWPESHLILSEEGR